MSTPLNSNEDPQVLSFNQIRRSIGYLGIFFPFILWIGSRLLGKCHTLQASISDYYHTTMGDVFVGLLVAIALFLVFYRGYDNRDAWLTNIAGAFAIMVAFFPNNNDSVFCPAINLADNDLRNTTHFVSAAIFFFLLAIISIFQFTKASTNPTEKKLTRNKVYRLCGIVILICIVLIFVFKQWKVWTESTFWLETIALIAFGFSWLTKGEALKMLRDLRNEEVLKQAALKTVQN